MLFTAMLRTCALVLVLGTTCNEAQKAPPVSSGLSRSAANQLRAVKSELATERRILATVEKQETETTAKLADKKAKEGKLTEQLQKMKQLHEQLKKTEQEKSEVIHEAKRVQPVTSQANAPSPLGLLSIERAAEQDLEAAEQSHRQQQAAEMSSLSAQETHFRSEIQRIRHNLSSAELETDRAQRQAGPLRKAEEKEVHNEALLQASVQSRSVSSRASRARSLARSEQGRMLSKQEELAQLNFAIGNSTVLLEKEKGALQAERLHVEDVTREATVLTDHLAAKEDQLKHVHETVANLGTELTQKHHKNEALLDQTATLKDRIKKDAEAGGKKVTSLLQQLEEKDAQVNELRQKVTASEGKVKDVMSTLKGYMDRSKATVHKAKAQVLLQESQTQDKASAASNEIQAARRQNAALKAQLSAKLQEVEARAAAREAAELKEYQQSHNTAAMHTLQSVTQAHVQAQRRQNEEQAKKASLIQTRLHAEVQGTMTAAERSISRSNSEMRSLHESITRVQAFEAVKVAKVNKQMTEMMKTGNDLEAVFEEADAKVDKLVSQEAEAEQRLEKVRREDEASTDEYDAAKGRVEKIYLAMRDGGASMEVDTVRKLNNQLKNAKAHKEQALALLQGKLHAQERSADHTDTTDQAQLTAKHLRTAGLS